jgi:hypothetical protein
MTSRTLLAAAALGACTGTAHASGITIAEQTFNPEVVGYQVSEAVPGGLFDSRAADNFTVAQPVIVTHASWVGAEESFFSNDFPGNLDSFLVEFFDDSGGTPGASLYDETIEIENIQTVDTGFNIANDPDEGDIFEFTVTLATPLVLAPGEYWFSTGAIGIDDFFNDDSFFWGFSGDGDDTYAVQTPANSGFPFFIPAQFVDPDNADLAFTLRGVPSPGAAGLLGAAGLAALRRRR